MKKQRKELTPEQIAARDARRARFRELARQVASMSDEQRQQLIARLPAVVTIEGRPLSPCNTILCSFQNPAATLVGGFRQWIAHGRTVRKGERGLMIWVPTSGRSAGAEGESSAVVVPDSAGEHGDNAGGSVRFICGTVFDVTQTEDIARGDDPEAVIDATPLPKLEPVAVEDDACRFPTVGKPRAAEEMARQEELVLA